jgi:hypothetical protein
MPMLSNDHDHPRSAQKSDDFEASIDCVGRRTLHDQSRPFTFTHQQAPTEKLSNPDIAYNCWGQVSH